MTYLERIKQTVQESLRMGDHELATDLRLLLAVVEAAEAKERASDSELTEWERVCDDLTRALAALKKEAE